LSGFQRTDDQEGIEILTVLAWDYPALINTYEKAARIAREEHVPVLVHVQEATQPQGHSTSGSHERYKSDERLQWEEEFCCIRKMRNWLLEEELATDDELRAIEDEAKSRAKEGKDAAWNAFITELEGELTKVDDLLEGLIGESARK